MRQVIRISAAGAKRINFYETVRDSWKAKGDYYFENRIKKSSQLPLFYCRLAATRVRTFLTLCNVYILFNIIHYKFSYSN